MSLDPTPRHYSVSRVALVVLVLVLAGLLTWLVLAPGTLAGLSILLGVIA